MLQEYGETLDGAEIIIFASTEEWVAWLASNFELEDGVWVKIAKKGSGKRSITIAEALDGALCYGWIDSQRKSCDAEYYLQRYSPRRAKGSWSKVNVDKVEVLIEAGRMREPGFAAIAAAKADGRWDAAYLSQRVATVPDDLAEALAGDVVAGEAFEGLDRTGRYGVLLRLMKAKPGARAGLLSQIVEGLRGGSAGEPVAG
jgi:uncharacterized protein YdeI (YjbR/CyaY-like superfamily)